ncbi:hypothetical protein JYU34_003653 [Plutella xylostella]|uniref:Uncharacterized protein n=1 Tax=Plutella xylostella TaxID=51655 RepID=A0ABQ7R0N2_PLUXY|nr:hypothetical protein JYU34_003653 [Plutella xylostella]
MKTILAFVVVSCALGTQGYPYYPYYGSNLDSLSYGSHDGSQGAMVLNRYYQPYYRAAAGGGGVAAFMYQQPSQPSQGYHQPAPSQGYHHPAPSQGYYQPDRRQVDAQAPPQQNEVYYPQQPDETYTPKATEQTTKLIEADPTTEKIELFSTTLKTIEPEITEPEVEEVEEPKPRRRVSKKKQVKRPVEDEEDDELARMPGGTFFPMFFGWGRSGQGQAPGVMAIANAYSTGRGGVSSSHATAYGPPRTEPEYTKSSQ